MISPCVNLCRIAPESGLCLGCKRSLSEIADWAGMSAGERAEIMAQLPLREPRKPAGR
ncbi:DUF1289 domain-containing protein [Paracoccus cavernae]|uniref:DUF1289 domain-containing protein n=1 Tax=Paracoccus cavernae TaxID=1571207 RepID=UPI0035F31FE6